MKDETWVEGEVKLKEEDDDNDAEETSLGVLRPLIRSSSLRRVALTSLSHLSYTADILHQYHTTKLQIFFYSYKHYHGIKKF